MAKYDGEELQIFNYDVFISFRGEDTRHTFAKFLHKELKRKGIRTFIDNEMLKAGNVISPALSKAIEESTVLIVVLSENYASSTWCLEELVKILECSRRGGNQQLVYPIFYHVDPSDVRHQRQKYGEAMAVHENKFGNNPDKVRSWRLALNQVCQLVGQHIKAPGDENSNRDEINEVEEIVEKVYAKIISKPLHGKDPVGFEQRIKELKSLLDMKANDDSVCMLGIHGLGGIGKTEIAKALYSKIVHKFEAASFIANVREKSSKINGLEDLQMALLSNMSEELETGFGSASRGMYEIKRRLGKKKVLLVLDDVDDKEQLNNLAGGCDWFGLGSRIVITTRDEDLLRHHRVEKTYKMVELNEKHSLELFCQNAFGKSHPKKGYEDLCYRAVKYGKGLPLALKVLGTDLATEDNLEYWEYSLNEYKKYLNPRIQDVLQRSYERLQYNVMQVFLDIAFFFNGERLEYVEKVLQEFNASHAIKVLVHKSLLTVEDGCLNMNGLIQDMAREIVRKGEPKNPGKRSRLCSPEDVTKVLTEDLGTDAIEGIILDAKTEVLQWGGTAFEKMRYLRILIVRNTKFSTEPKRLPNNLRLLDWEEYPSKFFPPEFHPKDIIVFKLCKSINLTLGKPFKKFSGLTSMNFSSNHSITAIPDVSEAPNLREVTVDDCKNLIKFHESVGVLKLLAYLSASRCSKLRDFPRELNLPSLELLDLNSCTRLEDFPEIKENMDQPLEIYMKSTAIEELPNSIRNLTGLVSIEMTGCRKLRYIPSSLFMLKNIDTFKFGGCSSKLGKSFTRFAKDNATTNGRSALKTLHIGNGGLSDVDLDGILKSFPELRELIASGNNFVSLPDCIRESVHLTSLDVSFCTKLRKIPECSNLRILNVDGCENLEEISELPSTIQKVDARYCRSLTPQTSAMLWSQVKKEIRGLEVIMYPCKVPGWFDWRDNDGGNPRFWARGKFPIVALALSFKYEEEKERSGQLILVINGKCVPRKGYYNLGFGSEFVLVCDLRLLFSEEEWLGLDAFLEHDWNLVQVSFEEAATTTTTTKTLVSWGVYAYKQETNMEDVSFMCPSSDDPLLQELMMAAMIKDGCFESEARNKLYWKSIEEHKALRDKFETHQTAAELEPLLEQLNINIGSASKLGAVLKGRDENLKGLCDAGIEGFRNSKEFQDLMSVVYLKGLRDGVLETQAILVALDMDRSVTIQVTHHHIDVAHDHHVDPAADNNNIVILNQTTSPSLLAAAGSQLVDNPAEELDVDDDYHVKEHDVTHEDAAAGSEEDDNPAGDTSHRSRRGFRSLFFKK